MPVPAIYAFDGETVRSVNSDDGFHQLHQQGNPLTWFLTQHTLGIKETSRSLCGGLIMCANEEGR